MLCFSVVGNGNREFRFGCHGNDAYWLWTDEVENSERPSKSGRKVAHKELQRKRYSSQDCLRVVTACSVEWARIGDKKEL